MTVKEIVYFDRPGPQNTDAVVEAVKKRREELGIGYVVVASNSGETALKLWNALKDADVKLISIPHHAGFSGGDKQSITPEKRRELEEKGIEVLMASHALSGVGRSIGSKFGGACTAAAFLRQFVDDKKWAHLDIASVEAFDKATEFASEGSTGFGVRLLTSYLMNLTGKK